MVRNTTRSWLNTGRNVVCDNFFTSIPLAEDLLQQHTTILGTLRQNKPEIPPEMKPNNGREGKSSIFAFSENPAHTCILRSNKRKGYDSSLHRAY